MLRPTSGIPPAPRTDPLDRLISFYGQTESATEPLLDEDSRSPSEPPVQRAAKACPSVDQIALQGGLLGGSAVSF